MTRRLVLAAALAASLSACDAMSGLAGFLPGLLGAAADKPATPAPSASAPTTGASPVPTPTPDPRLPATPATITGDVLGAEGPDPGGFFLARLQVVGDAGDRAVFTVPGSAQVWRQDAAGQLVRASAAELRVGQRVKAWAGGPVRESFPIQFDARVVVIVPAPEASPAPLTR